jgi:hypothetical protein
LAFCRFRFGQYANDLMKALLDLSMREKAMTYDHPLVYTIGPAVSVLKIKHGITEIWLSNGKIMRLSLHVDGVEPTSEGSLNVSYNVIVETLNDPASPIMDVHEVVQ